MRCLYLKSCMAMEEDKHFGHVLRLIKADLSRFGHHMGAIGFLRLLSPYAFSFRMTFWYRIGHYLLICNHPVMRKVLMPFVRLIHQYNSYRTGIQLPFKLVAGGGLLFSHYSCIVINGNAKIGEHVTIAHGATIGNNFTKGAGAPIIGDNSVLGPGCKVLGPIELGHDTFVGANAVITRSFPSGSVLGGVNTLIGTNGIELVPLYS